MFEIVHGKANNTCDVLLQLVLPKFRVPSTEMVVLDCFLRKHNIMCGVKLYNTAVLEQDVFKYDQTERSFISMLK